MAQNISFQWNKDRGKKWGTHSSSIEAMLSITDQALLSQIDPKTTGKIADLACGAGGTTLKIQHHLQEDSAIYGYDISPELIALAQNRLKNNSYKSSVSFTLMDVAKNIPDPAPFNLLVSRFGIMFFKEPFKAFKNITQWLKPQGKFVFVVWGPPEENLWAYNVRQAISEVISIPTSDPEAPGPFRYDKSSKLLPLFESSGFTNIQTTKWKGLLPIGGGLSPEDAASFALSTFSVGELIAHETVKTQKQIHKILTQFYSKNISKQGHALASACTHIYTGIN